MNFKHFVTSVQDHAGASGTVGAVFGWTGYNLMKAVQIVQFCAGLAATLVSIGTLVIIYPKIEARIVEIWKRLFR